MTKTAGMGDNLYIGGVNIANDIGSLSSIGGGPAVLDLTGIDKSAMERLGSVRDGRIEFSAWYNSALAHPVLSALPTADIVLTYARGTVLGNVAACLIGKQINYDGNRQQDGAYALAVSAQANAFGLEWGNQLTAGQRTDTTATSPGTGVDLTAVSTAFGWQAYLQVFAGFVGTSATMTIQDSADNAAFANMGGGGGSFTAATGITTQRIVSPGTTDTVRRYVRVITTGTFTNVVFSVVFVRNISLTAF